MKSAPAIPTTAEAYLKQFEGETFVIKVGGRPLDNPDTLQGIMQSIGQFRDRGISCVFVHGGGVQVDEILGSSAKHPDTQLRITPASAIETVERARAELSERIWTHCNNANVQAEVLDPGVTSAERILQHGETGRVRSVSKRMIAAALARGKMPIIPFGGRDHEGRYLNANADDNAAEAAIELAARKLILLTNTDGVELPGRNGNGGKRKVSFMDSDRLSTLLRKHSHGDGGEPKFVIGEGMFPKLRAAQKAIDSRNVGAVHILRADGSALLDEVLTRTGSGTMIERFQSVLIDVAGEEDVESIEQLLAEAQKFTTPKGTSFLKTRSRQEIVRDLPGTLVFEHQGVPVGTICATPLARQTDTAVIRSFAVAENHQSSQYGRVLLEACLERIKTAGFKRAISITAAAQLQHLYRQYGGVKDDGAYADVLEPSLSRYDETERDMLHLYVFDMTAEHANGQ